MADQLADGRRFRALTILDVFTRESLAIEVGQRLKGEDVVGALNQIRGKRGVPKVLFCDNGSEFTSQIMDLWAYHNRVQIDFSRPGKPTDNAHVESFNGTLRAECLDVHWFATLTEAKQVIESWRREYNDSRPHRSLGERTPSELPKTHLESVTGKGDRSETGESLIIPGQKMGGRSQIAQRDHSAELYLAWTVIETHAGISQTKNDAVLQLINSNFWSLRNLSDVDPERLNRELREILRW